MSPADMSHANAPFDEFLKIFKTRMHNVFHDREDMNRLSTGRGLPPYVLREVMACNPLSVFIPAEYGGRGPKPQEGIAVIEAASYESLALALIFGINWALFLQPVAKYGQEEARRQVFDGFILTGESVAGKRQCPRRVPSAQARCKRWGWAPSASRKPSARSFRTCP